MDEKELKQASNILDGYGNEDLIGFIVNKPNPIESKSNIKGYNPFTKKFVSTDGTEVDCSNKSYEDIYALIIKDHRTELESKCKTNYDILPTITSSASYYVAYERPNSQCDWDRIPEYSGFSRTEPTPVVPSQPEPLESLFRHELHIRPPIIKPKKESKLKKIFSPCNLKKIVLYFTKGFNIVKPFIFKEDK